MLAAVSLSIFSTFSSARIIAGAFFVRRGNTGEPRSALQRRLMALQEGDHERGEGEESCKNRSGGESGGFTPGTTSGAEKLEGETSLVSFFIFYKHQRYTPCPRIVGVFLVC